MRDHSMSKRCRHVFEDDQIDGVGPEAAAGVGDEIEPFRPARGVVQPVPEDDGEIDVGPRSGVRSGA